MIPLEELTQIAIHTALKAGKIIHNNIHKNINIEKKVGGNTYASQIVTKVDKACEEVILKHLTPTCTSYDLGLLTEETEDNKSRFEKAYFWCIDPLDGTLAFINKRPGFSVAIALVAKDGTPKIGVVYDPISATVYHAIHTKGAFKNGIPWVTTSQNNYLTYVTDKKLADTPNQNKIKDILHKKVMELGVQDYQEISGAGAVLNAILVAENAPAIFVKLPKKEKGGGSLWDFAATACICKELGVQATTFKGNKLDLNNKHTTFMNDKGIYYYSIKRIDKVTNSFVNL